MYMHIYVSCIITITARPVLLFIVACVPSTSLLLVVVPRCFNLAASEGEDLPVRACEPGKEVLPGKVQQALAAVRRDSDVVVDVIV